jgi:hypothetical protein
VEFFSFLSIKILQAQVKIANLKAVLGFFRDRLSNKVIEVKAEASNRKLEIKATTQQEWLEAVKQIQEFVREGGNSPPEETFCTVTTKLETPQEVEVAESLVKELTSDTSKVKFDEEIKISIGNISSDTDSALNLFDDPISEINNMIIDVFSKSANGIINKDLADGLLPPSPPSLEELPEPIISEIFEDFCPKASTPLVRYPNLDCPDKTILNQKFSLFVQLLIEQPEPTTQAVYVEDTGEKELPPEVEVVLRVRGFDIEGSNTRTLQVDREVHSEERFVLIPRQLGSQHLRVDFYQNGRRIGTARRNVLIAEKQVNANVSQPNSNTLLELKTVATLPPPNLELCVELRTHNTLHFTLHSTKATVGYHHTKFGEVTLKGSPLEKMQAVYQQMSRLAAPIKPEEQAMAERQLAGLGNDLWDELIPDKLKLEYWHFKSRVKSFLITSDEPWVPWEAIKPYRYKDDDEREDDPFWCQQFALSRWLSGPGTTDELLVGNARSVAPIQVNLRSVQEEVAFVKQLSSLRKGISTLEPFSTSLEVLEWLEAGEFSMLHFACHGMFDVTSPNNSAIKLSDGMLKPSDIRARFGGRRLRPLVFINACHGARTEFNFTGLGGWAERLVEARVGAFVGAMWEVNDQLALRFARRFYTGLLKENETIAEAFRQAREEIRKLAPYNSTWLAYALYADPEGRIQDSKKVS